MMTKNSSRKMRAAIAIARRKVGPIRLIHDSNSKGNLWQGLQAHLNQRSLNAALRAYAEAMNSAQHLELGLVFLLLHVEHERTKKTLAELHDLHGYLFRRPLGHLINLLKKKEVPVSPQLEADLTKALDLRNFIAHRYFYERFVKWFLNSGLKDLTRELKEIRMTFDLVSKEIERLIESVSKEAKRVEDEDTKRFLEQEFLPSLVKVYAIYGLNRISPWSEKSGGINNTKRSKDAKKKNRLV